MRMAEAWFWYWVIRLIDRMEGIKRHACWRLFDLDPDGLSWRSDEEVDDEIDQEVAKVLKDAAADAAEIMEVVNDVDDPVHRFANEIESKIDLALIRLGMED